MAELERLILPTPRHVRKRHRVQRQRDAWQKAASRSVLRAALLQRVAPLQVLLARLQAQPLRVRLASRLEAPLRVHEPAPCVALEQRPQVLPARSALSPAQRKPQVHSVSRRPASRSLAEARQAWQVSSARPSQPCPWLLFPLWQPLPLALRLRRLPEGSCAPSQLRPRESSSSASSFP